MIIEVNPEKLLVGKKYYTGNTYQEVIQCNEQTRYQGLDENGNPSGISCENKELVTRVLWLSTNLE